MEGKGKKPQFIKRMKKRTMPYFCAALSFFCLCQSGQAGAGWESVPAVLAAPGENIAVRHAPDNGASKDAAQEREAVKELAGLYAKAAVLMDADSGRVLYEKNGYETLPMASTTKIMTCIVALENGNLEDTVTVSAYAASQPKVHLGMRQGQQFLLRDLLYSMMLESHNDSAVAIAEHIGAKMLSLSESGERTKEESKAAVAAFAGLMNQKARDIGCFDTFFITPNGLDAVQTIENSDTESSDADNLCGMEKRHSTTARDLASIMQYCVRLSPQQEMFLEITRTEAFSFTDRSGKSRYACRNHNAFLSMMDGALSGKTGFTGAAGYCYVGALERDGKCFTVALLACGWPNHKTWKWSDTKALMGYGLEHYEYHSFSELKIQEEWLKPIPVANGQTKGIGEEAYTGVTLQKAEGGLEGILLREDENIDIECEVKKELTAPHSGGTEVGQIRYLAGGELLRMDLIVTLESVEEIDFTWCMKQVIGNFLLWDTEV